MAVRRSRYDPGITLPKQFSQNLEKGTMPRCYRLPLIAIAFAHWGLITSSLATDKNPAQLGERSDEE